MANTDHLNHDVYVHSTSGLGLGVTCRTCVVDLCWNQFDMTLFDILQYVDGTLPPMKEKDSMNITYLRVVDPRRNGEWVDPYIVLTVDEPVYEIDDPVHSPVLPNMRVIPCGPFYAAERQAGPGNWYDLNDTSDISEVNKAGIIKQQLAPMHVEDPEQEHDLYMEVPRLRRLLRKHTGKGITSWKLMVDEEAALLGQLTWRVDAADPMCYGGAIPYGDHCSRDVSRTIFTRGAHLPMCAAHVRAYEDSLRSSRISR